MDVTADVTVVGSGPNGLAAAVTCARAGLRVVVFEAEPTAGGGARTATDANFPDVRHDVCSAVHPLALTSPFLAEFDLPARGVRLVAPPVSYANPLPGRPAAVAYRDLERTCAELDHPASWRRLFGPLVDRADGVAGVFLGDRRSVPPRPAAAARAGLEVLAQSGPAWSALRGEDARALFTGVGAHAISPMPSLVNAGAAVMLGTAAHVGGWPVPVGGTQAITDALLADLTAHGGRLITGHRVTSPPPGVVLYDTAPTALLDVYGPAVPARYAKSLRRYRFGPGVCKVDFVLAGEIPWRDARLGGAATVHLGGDRPRMRRAEALVAAGRHADWPMTLAVLPHVADPSRIDAAGRRPLWTYCHVPAGSTVDQTATIRELLERAAPGFGDLVLASTCVTAAEMSSHDANYVGGDITLGGATTFAAIIGPTLRLNPWTTPIPGAYLCSSATPPGAGVHGMCGFYAARTVLRREFGVAAPPSLAPWP